MGKLKVKLLKRFLEFRYSMIKQKLAKKETQRKHYFNTELFVHMKIQKISKCAPQNLKSSYPFRKSKTDRKINRRDIKKTFCCSERCNQNQIMKAVSKIVYLHCGYLRLKTLLNIYMVPKYSFIFII